MLTDQDRRNIRAFKLRFFGKTSRENYNEWREMFSEELQLDSDWVLLHWICTLTGVKPVMLDCCPKSCVCYSQKYAHLDACPHCHTSRHNDSGKPRAQFCYFPLIPRLQALFRSQDMIEIMLYRARFVSSTTNIRDVFDSDWYQKLLHTHVEVDGKALPHRFFSSPHAIALSLATDGFLLFGRRRSGPSAMPILLQNLNLPPKVRTRPENLICLGVIPGPRQPKDLESFLCPLDDECAKLAQGVETYNASSQEFFDLYAYIVAKIGDILAIEKFLSIKGHNSLSGYRSCEIKGILHPLQSNYYYPTNFPVTHGNQPEQSWNPFKLPMRTHKSWLQILDEIAAMPTKSRQDALMKHYGLNGRPALHRVSSLDYARCCPWEWMHLLLENVCPNLVSLWTGTFKNLDQGHEQYEIAPHIWEEIGRETADAVCYIPAAFVRVLQNIATDRQKFTAESWGFWFVHVAPIVLEGRFKHEKYYKHMLLLVDIMKTTLQFEITRDQVDDLEEKIVDWVLDYERYVTDLLDLVFYCAKETK